MICIVNKYVPYGRFMGLAIWPFVFLKHHGLKKDRVFVNHERIHLRQQLELLIVPFFIWYVLEFLVRWLQYGNLHTAYHRISFEREAYRNEKNPGFLKNRGFWNFLNYF